MKPISERCRIQNLIDISLAEDIGSGDITSNSIIPEDATLKASIVSKENGVLCGIDIAEWVFRTVDKKIKLIKGHRDGTKVTRGSVIAEVVGPARGILAGERTALNFLQLLSGIATRTASFVRASGGHATILDTRKTAPGLRLLEKYAVRIGGGTNHRVGLFDHVLIKDNHISVAGGISKAINLARKKFNKVEVEVKSLKEAREAATNKATRIMLDNMTVPEIKKAVRLIRGIDRRIEIEVSGGVGLKNIAKIARTGADFISIGSLTHSAPALDISLKVK